MKKQLLILACFIINVSVTQAQKKLNIDSLAQLLEVWVEVPVVTPGKTNQEAPSEIGRAYV